DTPSEFPARGWLDIVKRVFARIGEDNVSMMAAAVGFYALLSIFPGLTALISLYGLVADPLDIEKFIDSTKAILPGEAIQLISSQMDALIHAPPSKLGIGLIVSVVLALWSANSSTMTMISALNVAFGEKEKRSYPWVIAIALGLTTGS